MIERCVVAIIAAFMFFAPAAQADVWVDPRVDEWVTTYKTVNAVLEPDDRIAVDIYDDGPIYVKPGTTNIVALGYELFIYADADIDQQTAMRILESTDGELDPVERIVDLIHRLHDYQEAQRAQG